MKTLVATIHSGMADRVRALLAFNRLAARTGREFLFIWQANEHCGAQFEDVFHSDRPIVTPDDPWPDIPYYEFDANPWVTLEKEVNKLSDVEVIKVKSFAVGQPYDDFGTWLKFTKEIQATADEFVINWLHGRTLGCHIRARDKFTEGVTPPLTWFTDMLDDVGSARQIFLASDSLEVRRALEVKYGTRLVEIQYKSLNCAEAQGVVDAATELAILRQCKTLVLSPYSGFSRMAMRRDTLDKVGLAVQQPA
jgi:hypothetical protein